MKKVSVDNLCQAGGSSALPNHFRKGLVGRGLGEQKSSRSEWDPAWAGMRPEDLPYSTHW